jgi:RimJ/RimL family protein N-acetyltransferase
MVSIQKIKPTDTAYYLYCENLLVASFPESERRDLAHLRQISMHNKAFSAHIIINDNQPAGLLNSWDFDDFIFIEHFAIDTARRNKGIGHQALKIIIENMNLPIVLEVELPEDEISMRRTEFYKRAGFQLWQHEYKQPPYRKGHDFLPMRLMAVGNLSEKNDFERVKNTLYNQVYFY